MAVSWTNVTDFRNKHQSYQAAGRDFGMFLNSSTVRNAKFLIKKRVTLPKSVCPEQMTIPRYYCLFDYYAKVTVA